MPASPTIVVHWLENSRSQRILWLLEELELAYTVKNYQRNIKTMLAPPDLKAIHPLGKSPVITIEDGGETITLAESGAIVEYLVETYGNGKLSVAASNKALRARYLYWLHFAEGTAMMPLIFSIVFAQMPKQSPFFVRPLVSAVSATVMHQYVKPKLRDNFAFVEAELEGKDFFVGDSLTGADVMMIFVIESLGPAFGFEAYPNMTRWLANINKRPAFVKAEASGGATDLGAFLR